MSLDPTQRDYLKQAIDLAMNARQKGNHPFGAVLVHNDNVVCSAENTVVTDSDCTQHAELRLVSQASRKFSPDYLKECTLFSSTEPCAMCVGAIVWAGIRKVVYGCSASRLEKFASGGFVVPCRDLFASVDDHVIVIGPQLEKEAENAHLGFWVSLQS